MTPSTIKNIREYNKKHSYLDISTLDCDTNKGNTACLSSFLHGSESENAIVSVTGNCASVNKNNFYQCLSYYSNNTNNEVY